jgi:UDP-N-acetyl-D-galactosamine dehydrogenase
MSTSLAEKIESRQARLAVIGLGYVGLPLAVEFGKHFPVIGFDCNAKRIQEVANGQDHTLETAPEEIRAARQLTCSANPADLSNIDFFIVTVPTPVDEFKCPDIQPLIKASETIGRALKPGAVVIYESTVYPGCTEEDCVPVLERCSGLTFNQDFCCGYTPERINPGDKTHTLTKVRKVTSGSTPETALLVDQLYRTIITAGTHLAPSIRVAEAAKVIENTQRDINIAFVNELAQIFDRMGIDTQDVLDAAGTKWNFLPFRPGLVGGHCIGVDPYYLTHKAQALGHHAEVILAGRRMNDGMGVYVANRIVKLMIKKGHGVQGSQVLMLGITFKENCPDIRNSRAIDVVRELQDFGCRVSVYDPWADAAEVRHEYGLELLPSLPPTTTPYDAVVLAVAHERFRELPLRQQLRANGVIFDIKGFLDRRLVDGRL